MKPARKLVAAAVTAALTALAAPAGAADADRLGKDLTATGAEKAGNKDGSIPAFAGWEGPSAGWSYGKKRADFFRHKAEKPLFTIDAGNVDKYADRLSPGQVALVKQLANYRMDVYPSHRTCGVPDFVEANTAKNAAGAAKLGPDGWSLKDAVVPGFPFPIPQNGVEAMLNAKLRYRGVAVEYKANITAVSPRKGGSEWIKAGSEQTNYMPWGVKGSNTLAKLGSVEYYTYFAYTTPAALAGQALAITTWLDQPANETFYYFPGQRRVRRMPSYAYDSPQLGMENQYTLDEPMVFNGALDRFDWKLAGKKELYVPYDSFGANDFGAKFEDVAGPDHIANDHRRYELHRVWVVEATVKGGTRHLAPKRTFYLDEDSWNMVLADDYDAQGKLWKVREGFLLPVYETGSCDVSAFAQYNLAEGRYVFDMHAAGTGSDMQWVTEPRGERYKPGFYTSDNLRAISDR
ncbi:DUF1329 domain-containing protein [Derxia gummosa]|uniref:DUF1329 domain-containing protein n=1 Tax=Derxia gummosa DSM 723 TaxID=1121388 RepID=A0A8B6X4S2_9BURK|nr:DUF1329 domain-containing protein [Derxia gummosa]